MILLPQFLHLAHPSFKRWRSCLATIGLLWLSLYSCALCAQTTPADHPRNDSERLLSEAVNDAEGPLLRLDQLTDGWWNQVTQGALPSAETLASLKELLSANAANGDWRSALEEYQHSLATPQSMPALDFTLDPSQHQLNLEDLRRYTQALLRLEQRANELAARLPLLRNALRQSDISYNRAREEYLKLGPNGPIVATAVDWITVKLRLEARRQELNRVTTEAAAVAELIEQLQDYLRGDAQRLVLNESQAAEWQKQLEQLAAQKTPKLNLKLPKELGLDPALLDALKRYFDDAHGLSLNTETQVYQLALQLAAASAASAGTTLALDPAQDSVWQAAMGQQLRTREWLTNNRPLFDSLVAELLRRTQEAPDSAKTKLLKTIQEVRNSIEALQVNEGQLFWLDTVARHHLNRSSPWPEAINQGFSKAWERFGGYLDQTLFTLNETPITIWALLRFATILLIAWALSLFFKLILSRVHSQTLTTAARFTLGKLIHYSILIIASFIALSSIGLDFSKLALIASAFGVGLGFGLQAIISNFVSGLILLFERSLKIGDFIELESGVNGEVREVNIRSTLITTNDNIDIVVPNSEFVNGRVINWTLREASRRLRIPFLVAYGTDKELVKKAALEAAHSLPFTMQGNSARQAQVWVVDFPERGLQFELVVWLVKDAVNRPQAVTAAYYWAIEDALRKYGIHVPLPQMDLHLRSIFGESNPPPWEEWVRRGASRAQAAARRNRNLSRRERATLHRNDAAEETIQSIAAAKSQGGEEETTKTPETPQREGTEENRGAQKEAPKAKNKKTSPPATPEEEN